MVSSKITLYVDIVSPFAYMAYFCLRNSPTFKQCDITYVPVFLGGIMKATDNRPPIQIRNKDKWVDLERKRWCKKFNIPIADRTPDGFPISTIAIQRALVATSKRSPNHLIPAIDAFYHAFWVLRNEGKVEKPDGIAKVLSAVMDANLVKSIMEDIQTPEVKNLLTKNSDQALADGAFGLPYYVATNSKGEREAFWGFDHLGQLVDHLGLERSSQGGWRAML